MRLYNISSYILYIKVIHPYKTSTYFLYMAFHFTLTKNNVIKCKYIPNKILLCIFTQRDKAYYYIHQKHHMKYYYIYTKSNKNYESIAHNP